MPFEYLAHTADLRATLSGVDLPDLYRSAADLVREIVVGSCPVAAAEERRLDVDGADVADEAERFFRFVRELIYLYDCEGFLPATVVGAGEPGDLRVRGETFDARRHVSERQIKAVTRHGYRFERRPDGYRAELVFDL